MGNEAYERRAAIGRQCIALASDGGQLEPVTAASDAIADILTATVGAGDACAWVDARRIIDAAWATWTGDVEDYGDRATWDGLNGPDGLAVMPGETMEYGAGA